MATAKTTEVGSGFQVGLAVGERIQVGPRCRLAVSRVLPPRPFCPPEAVIFLTAGGLLEVMRLRGSHCDYEDCRPDGDTKFVLGDDDVLVISAPSEEPGGEAFHRLEVKNIDSIGQRVFLQIFLCKGGNSRPVN